MNRSAICIFLAAILLTVAVSVYFLYNIAAPEQEIPDPLLYTETEPETETEPGVGAFPIDGTPETKNTVTLSPPESGETGAASSLLAADFVLNEDNLG